jgi:hypothetical protein
MEPTPTKKTLTRLIILVSIAGFFIAVVLLAIVSNIQSPEVQELIDNSNPTDYIIQTPEGPVTVHNVTPDQTGEPLIIRFTEA